MAAAAFGSAAGSIFAGGSMDYQKGRVRRWYCVAAAWSAGGISAGSSIAVCQPAFAFLCGDVIVAPAEGGAQYRNAVYSVFGGDVFPAIICKLAECMREAMWWHL